MSGRALLNVIEADMLDGLDGDARSEVRSLLSDPAAYTAAKAQEKAEERRAALIEAGAEFG